MWGRIVFAGGLLAFVAIDGAAAGDLEDGDAALQRRDYATAMRLLRPLAEQGNSEAQDKLGMMYVNGQGMEKDYHQARIWFRKAADQGQVRAQENLGFMYSTNWMGGPPDYQQAAAWFRKAADQGSPSAQYNLGMSCEKGEGVPQDYVQAHMWFNLAAARASSAFDRQMAAEGRDRIAAKMTPAQIAEAQRMAREWAPK
jgi:uncharacterized protein